MTVTIAVAGKGGTGKTTLSGLLIRYLVQHEAGKVLAIDADPSSNLHLVLGLPLSQTVGDIREEAAQGVSRPGMPRQDWLSYAVRMAVEEGDDFDLLAWAGPRARAAIARPTICCAPSVDGIGAGYDYRGDGQRGRHGAPEPAHHARRRPSCCWSAMPASAAWSPPRTWSLSAKIWISTSGNATW